MRCFLTQYGVEIDAPEPTPLTVHRPDEPTEIVTVSRQDFQALERAAERSPSGKTLRLDIEVAERLAAAGVPLRRRQDGRWRVVDGVTVARVEPGVVVPLDPATIPDFD